MHSLFWRIFWSFWLAIALILIGTVSAAVGEVIQHREQMPWVQRGRLFQQAARAFEHGGAGALERWARSLEGGPFYARTYVIGPDERDLLGRPLPPLLRAFLVPGPTASHGQPPPIGGALVLTMPDGRMYQVVVTELQRHPLLFFGALGLPGVAGTTLAVALVVSTLICFLLARYLVGPIERLRQAARTVAAGNLDVRVGPSMHGRQDDLGRLAADFDAMTERVQSLLETKQQLLRDVSHELRSPLTRLQLALSLAQRHEELPRQLERIGREADRLEQLIARILKLARLERPAGELAGVLIEATGLLRQIVADVAIEADARGCRIELQAQEGLETYADAELLRSAFENVIRNAVRYGAAGKEVRIEARRSTASGGQAVIEVTVRDHGPGVPQKDLKSIFEPFYRVDAARHRAVGGDGLGLTIAARAIAAHGGTIEARNAEGGGLVVTMRLPVRALAPA
ncbi:MAG: sensor histidine kinase [Steroidobacteraceae bacterium]